METMALTRRERALAFLAGVLMCSVLSSGLSVVFRAHDSVLSGTRSKPVSPPFPHRERAHSSSVGFAFWPWSWLRSAKSGTSKNRIDTQTWERSNHQELGSEPSKMYELPLRPRKRPSTADSTGGSGEKGTSSTPVSGSSSLRDSSEGSDENVGKAYKQLDGEEVARSVETDSPKRRFSPWPWSWFSSGKVLNNSSLSTGAATRPVAPSPGDQFRTGKEVSEVPEPRSGNTGPFKDEKVNTKRDSFDDSTTVKVLNSTSDDRRHFEDANGIGQFAWIQWIARPLWRPGKTDQVRTGKDGVEVPIPSPEDTRIAKDDKVSTQRRTFDSSATVKALNSPADDEKRFEHANGNGQLAWTQWLARPFQRTGNAADTREQTAAQEASSTPTARRVEGSLVKEEAQSPGHTATDTATGEERVGGSVHVSVVAVPRRPNPNVVHGQGIFTMILSCIMGVLVCALTVFGTVRVMRARWGDAEGRLPLVTGAIEDSGNNENGDMKKMWEGKRARSQAEITQRSSANMRKSFVEEIAPEEMV